MSIFLFYYSVNLLKSNNLFISSTFLLVYFKTKSTLESDNKFGFTAFSSIWLC